MMKKFFLAVKQIEVRGKDAEAVPQGCIEPEYMEH